MVSHYTHDHPLCREDSSMLFEILDEIFWNAPFYLSLKPHQDKRGSQNAQLNIISHCAGEDKWEKELKKNEDFLKEQVWTVGPIAHWRSLLDSIAMLTMQLCCAAST